MENKNVFNATALFSDVTIEEVPSIPNEEEIKIFIDEIISRCNELRKFAFANMKEHQTTITDKYNNRYHCIVENLALVEETFNFSNGCQVTIGLDNTSMYIYCEGVGDVTYAISKDIAGRFTTVQILDPKLDDITAEPEHLQEFTII